MPGSAGTLEIAMLPVKAGKLAAAETSATSGMPATAVTKATAGTPTTHGTPAKRMPATTARPAISISKDGSMNDCNSKKANNSTFISRDANRAELSETNNSYVFAEVSEKLVISTKNM